MYHVATKFDRNDKIYHTLDPNSGKSVDVEAAKIFDHTSCLEFHPNETLVTIAQLLKFTARAIQDASFIPRVPTVGLLATEDDRIRFRTEIVMANYARPCYSPKPYYPNDVVSTITTETICSATNHALQRALRDMGCKVEEPAPLVLDTGLFKPHQLKQQYAVVELTGQVEAAVIQLIGESGLQKLRNSLRYITHFASTRANNISYMEFLKDLRRTLEIRPLDIDNPNKDFSQISTLYPFSFAESVRVGFGMLKTPRTQRGASAVPISSLN